MPLALTGFCLLFLLLTNRWLSWYRGLDFLMANDVFSYMRLMESAPALPQVPLAFHHAQRFVGPYTVGLLSRVTTIPYPYLCTAFAGLYLLLVSGLMYRICLKLNLPLFGHGLCMGLLILNPYLFRYYLLVPGMLPDMVFVLGLTLGLLGLVERWGLLVLVGLAIAACGRQTALMLLPGVFLWIGWGSGWTHRWRTLGAIALLTLGIYQVTGWIALSFATRSKNLEHLTGIVDWLVSSEFSLAGLLEHILRLVVPLVLPLGIFGAIAAATKWKFPVEVWASWIMAVCISAQPFLAGPVITGQNASRLSGLGLVCGLVAIALLLYQRPNPPWNRQFGWKIILGGCLVLASFHHLYTWVGPASALQFAALHLVLAAIASLATYLILRPHRDFA